MRGWTSSTFAAWCPDASATASTPIPTRSAARSTRRRAISTRAWRRGSHQSRGGVMSYINVFRTMFPEGAGYEHDKIERRTELTEAQKPEEPQNADSHLAFMAGALRTCVAYRNRPPSRSASSTSTACTRDARGGAGRPCSAIRTRSRRARRASWCPCPGHAVDSVNLKDPAARHLRAVPAARRAARRHEGAYPAVARPGRASRGPDRQRVRDAADAARPVGGPARSAAVHG